MAAVGAPESPTAARGEGEGGERWGGSDEGQEEGRAAAARPGKETRVVEAVALVSAAQILYVREEEQNHKADKGDV